ncbi:PilW family protein [Acidiferrobacter sp.]|uniref:PilW family protein n=1 Tax=Acidiferrobacter sp. TaxID=1872107 RepID=UPI00261E60A9|nr:PilW family protein [Acidiferrobacter sp.]
MLSRRWSATRPRVAGFTLIEMMVALVVSALAAVGIYQGFISTSNAFRQTKAQGNAWQQARTAMTLITEAVESAGYGLPITNCSQIYTNNFQSAGGGLLSLAPVSAQSPVSATLNPYDPSATPVNAGVGSYELQTVTGGGNYGSAPVTYISSVPSLTAPSIKVASTLLLNKSDLFLVTLPNASCVLGQITNTNPATATVVFNSGRGGSAYNLPQAFSAVDPGVTTAQLLNAGFVDLGNASFAVDNFYVGYKLNPITNTFDYNSVPSLYMQQYTALTNNASVPPSELIARGVVDMQVEFGYGTGGFVTSWGAPGTQPGRDVDAVKVVLLVRSTRVVPHAGTVTGNRITLFQNSTAPNNNNGVVSYVIPTALPANNTTGCLDGNCSHYLYHVFKTVIPVRNVIWAQ